MTDTAWRIVLSSRFYFGSIAPMKSSHSWYRLHHKFRASSTAVKTPPRPKTCLGKFPIFSLMADRFPSTGEPKRSRFILQTKRHFVRKQTKFPLRIRLGAINNFIHGLCESLLHPHYSGQVASFGKNSEIFFKYRYIFLRRRKLKLRAVPAFLSYILKTLRSSSHSPYL